MNNPARQSVGRMREWLASLSARGARAEPPAESDRVPAASTKADARDIRYAYRLLLGREPDPEGLETYSRLVRSGDLSAEDLGLRFLGSREFVMKHQRASLPVEVKIEGYSIFVRPIDHDIGLAIRNTRRYEPHVTRVIREVVRTGDTVVDVGANLGFFTALAASLVGDTGKVIAIEPMDKNLQLIHATVRSNRFRQVEIVPYAVSDSPGQVVMSTGVGTSNGQIVGEVADASTPSLFAQAKKLDDLLPALSALDVLKIDIEGYELRALRGFETGLARHRPLLLTEFHPKCMRENAGVEPGEYLAFLFAYGSRIEVLHHDETRFACADAAAVLREWEEANRRLGGNGTSHLDLFVTPRG
jgi:FkbM family methyltransferase